MGIELSYDGEIVPGPGGESPVHFHYRKTLSGEFNTRRSAQMANM